MICTIPGRKSKKITVVKSLVRLAKKSLAPNTTIHPNQYLWPVQNSFYYTKNF